MAYVKLTNFAAKDALITGNPAKVVRGTEIGAEFDSLAIEDALNLKNGGSLGVPASGTLTNCTGLPVAGGGTGSTTAAAAKIALQVVTAATGSIIAPVGTTAQRDVAPSAGYIRYNTTTATFEGYGSAWGSIGGGAVDLTTNVTGTLPVANGGTGVTTSTGTGANVLGTSPTLTTPILGTPTSGALDNCTGTNLCKAWVRFTATATPSITASFNIASVVYSATGIYTITFTNALADANYCVVTGTNYNNAAGSFAYGAGFYSLTASNFVCQTYIVSGVSLLGASGSVYIAVFR